MAQATPIVFVVDDDISVRESLESLIPTKGGDLSCLTPRGPSSSGRPATRPRCLVLDVGLPDLNGLELQRSIAAEQAVMPIIFITGYGDIPMTVEAMKAGAFEFFTKPYDDDACRRLSGKHLTGAALSWSRNGVARTPQLLRVPHGP